MTFTKPPTGEIQLPLKVNLDALIPRDDMASGDASKMRADAIYHLKHTDLTYENNQYQVLRKPDFQRETYSWTPEKVCDLISSYAKESLVPAIVLWRSPANLLFLID